MVFYRAEHTTQKCFHCGAEAKDGPIVYDDKHFCCEGCKSVFQILKENNLAEFYTIDQEAGTPQKNFKKLDAFAYLDHEEIASKLIDFRSDTLCKVSFNAPAIHCSSCIWLLENLYKIHKGVLNTEVNFVKKEIYINYNPQAIGLKELVYLLSKIGYEPEITLENIKQHGKLQIDRSLWYKLGVAGFAFGNIMLFSLPSYFGLEAETGEKDFDLLFKIVNLFLSLPVLLYSASTFLNSAYKSLRNKQINLDVPLCLGILALYGSSLYEIFSGTGPGYLDSFAALIFFLLAGRAIQKLSFQKLRFDRDNSSYFPLATIAIKEGKETTIPLTELKVGDRILVRNNELIPADGQLREGTAHIDYSFVTGEALPQHKVQNELLYAGGRQLGGAIEIQIHKEPSQSYLTQLWNAQRHDKELIEDYESVVNQRSKYFTYAVLTVAFSAFAYWTYTEGLAKGALVLATTLNVSCPCALAVAIPFTYANIIRHLGRRKFYLKNAQVVERINNIDTIVFDKTGTLTDPENSKISYEGEAITFEELQIIKTGLRQSTHPLSVQLYKHLDIPLVAQVHCEEVISKGLVITVPALPSKHELFKSSGLSDQTMVSQKKIKLGSYSFVTGHNGFQKDLKTSVYISVNNILKGRFVFENKYVEGIQHMVSDLNTKGYKIDVLSGDNASEKVTLQKLFSNDSEVLFNRKPEDKLQHIKYLQANQHQVMMVGDGLNDSVALQQSNVGLAIIHDHTQFSPSSDAILAASEVNQLPSFIKYCKSGIGVVKGSFIFSSMYNAFGLSFAVQGLFSPVFAAILMPISSITVVLFSVLLTNYKAKQILKKYPNP